MADLLGGGDWTGLGAPETHLPVTRARDHPSAVGSERHAADAQRRLTARARERPRACDRRAGTSVEAARGAIGARRRDRRAVGGEGDLPDVVAVVHVDGAEPGLAG